MFGDWLWVSNRSDVQGLRLATWVDDIRNKKMSLAVVDLGTGHAVPTVRYQSEHTAAYYNGSLIRTNPRDYEVLDDEISIALESLEGINRILDLICV